MHCVISSRIFNRIYSSLAYLNPQDTVVTTPTGLTYAGTSIINESEVVAVSVVRAGDSMLESFMRICPLASAGKILIQRDEATALPTLFYQKLPPLQEKYVVLLDPMLATGHTAIMAIRELLAKGASIDKLLFVNVVASPEGIAYVHSHYPTLLIITAEIDQGLNEKVSLPLTDVNSYRFR